MSLFQLVSDYAPAGDQPKAIDQLSSGLENGVKDQVLLGVTGSGKTYTMACVIARLSRPTLVIAHNKTLAAQLCSELRTFFPNNAVEYFVSYYDHYQPEAYIPQTDTYIEKDASINEEIDRLRHRATMSLFERRDVIVVASVSCIYGLGSPQDYLRGTIFLKAGQILSRDKLLKDLVAIQYERNDIDLVRGRFRVRGDIVEIFPAYEQNIFRISFFGDEIEKIFEIHPVSGERLKGHLQLGIYPATHFVTFRNELDHALESIAMELEERLKVLRGGNQLLAAERLAQRTHFDLEMIREVGYCQGIENYSRHLDGRRSGEPPNTLLSYFPEDYLLFIDESHVTLPQLRGMYQGDRARKEVLVEYGFRLPSALDNRPLRFDEFEERRHQVVYVSATPGEEERQKAKGAVKLIAKESALPKEYPVTGVVEQVIRPTGLVDPHVRVCPTEGQIDDLLARIQDRVQKQERVLITTLTKKMAEHLASYLADAGIKVRYLHSEVHTLDRIDVLRELRLGHHDVLVGVNLLREGLDLPEVSLVAILDADKEGFLRAETSLIQTMGRAARHASGEVVLYADRVTGSMQRAMQETKRRRDLQLAYNRAHGIQPKTIVKAIADIRDGLREGEALPIEEVTTWIPREELPHLIRKLEEDMQQAALELAYERAARLRDRIISLKDQLE